MQISLARLALLLLGLSALLFGVLGFYTYWQVREVDREQNERQFARAHAEIMRAVDSILSQTRAQVRALASWDEARQQLADPAYYGYWRSERLTLRLTYEHAIGVELYDAQGRALAEAVAAPFVAELRYLDQRPLLVREQGRDFLLLAEPVRAAADDGPVLGFAVLAVDLASALLPPDGLRFAAFDSRVTTLAEQARVPTSDVTGKIRYHVRPDTAALSYQAMLRRLFLHIAVAALLFLGVVMLSLERLVGRPLVRLASNIERLAEDADESRPSGLGVAFAIEELERVRRSINNYQSRLEVMLRGLDRKNRRLWKLAHHDSLTGCLNRRAFEDDWRHILELAERRSTDVSLILMDCNHFRAINDTYGHSVGDDVLKGIAATVRKILGRGDRLYRIANDEFAVIFVDAAREHAAELARRCLASIEQHGFTQFGMREPVRLSVGIAHCFGGDARELQGLYRRANVAMFRAKRPDAPPLAVYEPEMEGTADIALSSHAASAVDEAISTGGNIEMSYQPVVDLRSRSPVYYEGLVRLRAEGRLMTPDEFLLQVETRHLEAEFDEAVFAALLNDLNVGRLPPGLGMSINVSGASIVDPAIEKRLAPFTRFMDRHELLLEVTETTLISQLQLASATLERLRHQGFKIALDDFGSGYSSLRYLADMPVDVVKFDITLVRALCEDTPRGRMLAKLVGLLKEPGYTLVAEGLENEHMVERTRTLGFDYGQGYLIGPPLAMEAQPVSG